MIEVELARADAARPARPPAARDASPSIVVPEPRARPPSPRATGCSCRCSSTRASSRAARASRSALAAELAVLPAALALDLDGWKRLMTWAPTALEPIEVELATTPLAQAKGRKALAEAERKRQASRRSRAPAAGSSRVADPPPLVGRDALLGELSRALDNRARRSVLLVGDEAAGKSALVDRVGRREPAAREVWATSASELIAGASGLGEWQARVAAVLAAAETLDAILYFDDFGALFADRPAEGGIELGAAMRRHVVDGRVRVVGELTAVALDRAERHDVSLIGAMLRVTRRRRPIRRRRSRRASAWAAHWRADAAAPPADRAGDGADRGRSRAPLPALPRVPRQGGAPARGAARRARCRRATTSGAGKRARRERAVRRVLVGDRHPDRAARRQARDRAATT